MIIKCKDSRGTEFIESASSAQEIIPMQPLFRSNSLRKGISALMIYKDQLFPVKGPIPKDIIPNDTDASAYWMLCYHDHAKIIKSLPEVLEQKEDEFGDVILDSPAA